MPAPIQTAIQTLAQRLFRPPEPVPGPQAIDRPMSPEDTAAQNRDPLQMLLDAIRGGVVGAEDSPAAKFGSLLSAMAPVAAPLGALRGLKGAQSAEEAVQGARAGLTAEELTAAAKQFKGAPLRGKPAPDLGATLARGAQTLKPSTVDRFGSFYDIGNQLPHQSNWEGATNEELLRAFAHDPQMADRWAQFWGALSPQNSVPKNTQESISALLYHLEHPDLPFSVPSARGLTAPEMIGNKLVSPDDLPIMQGTPGQQGAVTLAGSKVPNLNRVLKGERLGGEKVVRMGSFMRGAETPPMDVHAIYGLTGQEGQALQGQMPSIRAAVLKADKGLKTVSDADLAARYEVAVNDALKQIDPSLHPNRVFGITWEGARAHKGLTVQGGPIDILRKKGLLEAGAMLDPQHLRRALQQAGWTGVAIAGFMTALGHNDAATTAAQEPSTGNETP